MALPKYTCVVCGTEFPSASADIFCSKDCMKHHAPIEPEHKHRSPYFGLSADECDALYEARSRKTQA